MVDAATPFTDAAEAKKTNPQRIHWYDGADLSEENIESIEKMARRYAGSGRYASLREDEQAPQNLSLNAIQESFYIENFMRTLFSSWCENPNSVQADDLQFLLRNVRVNPDFWLDDDGMAPLMVAKYADTVEKLLDSGANPNAQTVAQGRTPLMIRAMNYRPGSMDSAEVHLLSFLTLLKYPKTDLRVCDKQYGDLMTYTSGKPILENLVRLREGRDTLREALVDVLSEHPERESGKPIVTFSIELRGRLRKILPPGDLSL